MGSSEVRLIDVRDTLPLHLTVGTEMVQGHLKHVTSRFIVTDTAHDLRHIVGFKSPRIFEIFFLSVQSEFSQVVWELVANDLLRGSSGLHASTHAGRLGVPRSFNRRNGAAPGF